MFTFYRQKLKSCTVTDNYITSLYEVSLKQQAVVITYIVTTSYNTLKVKTLGSKI